jgi:hypothetical protein
MFITQNLNAFANFADGLIVLQFRFAQERATSKGKFLEPSNRLKS